MTRRDFVARSIQAAGVLAAVSHLGSEVDAQEAPTGWQKAIVSGMLPGDLDWAERFALAKRCRFDGIEMPPTGDLAEATDLAQLAREAGLQLHSVIYGGWGAPLSSGDPAVVEKGQMEIEQALRAAKAYGADTVLLVPAIVNESTRYADAYDRSQENLRPLLPLAEELGIVIAVENVWNNFLLSPLEFARYVDELDSPWLKAYFDCGNVVKFGWPEDWILTLGARIQKIHLKDFRRADGGQWTALREGDVNWPRVTDALKQVGYEGFFTCELGGGDEAYLTEVSDRVDLILSGQ